MSVDLGFEVCSGLCGRIGNFLMRPGGLLRFKLFSGLSCFKFGIKRIQFCPGFDYFGRCCQQVGKIPCIGRFSELVAKLQKYAAVVVEHGGEIPTPESDCMKYAKTLCFGRIDLGGKIYVAAVP